MEVQVIQALAPQEKERGALRVAAYCRVSTDMEEQESSYEAQCRHYSSYIAARPGWTLAGIFADEGISGTSTRGRKQFHAMIAACEAGEIDMIVTKSISRFARNTLDCLTYIRRLRDRRIPIYFETENINTMDARGELLLTIMASIAQQESQSISANVRMGIQYRMQEGKGRLDTTRFLGFTWQDGKLVIVPAEADIVRRIYREYLEGVSPGIIAKRLEADGAASPAGGARWYASTVSRILANEKYCGDSLLQKYYVESFLTHRVVKNTGQFPQYYVEDDHDPIVPKSVFFQVQGELLRRGALKGEPSQLRTRAEHPFSGKLLCEKCGRPLKRFTKQDGREADWRCRRRAGSLKEHSRDVKSACGCRFVPESEARSAVTDALNLLPERLPALRAARRRLENGALADVERLLDGSPAQEDRDALLLRRAELCNRALRFRLLEELAEYLADGTPRADASPGDPACRDRDDFFRRTHTVPKDGVVDAAGRVVGFDGDLVLRYIESVTVRGAGFTVRFKAGLAIDVP